MNDSITSKYCRECGSAISIPDKFCTSCGNRLRASDATEGYQPLPSSDDFSPNNAHKPASHSVSDKAQKGYFEGIAAGLFKENENGEAIFFPWGCFWGKGRVIANEPTKTNVRAFVMNYYRANLIISFGVVMFLDIFWLFLSAPLLTVWYHFSLKSLLHSCPYSEEKLTLKDSLTNSAAKYNKFTLYLSIIGSVVFVLSSLLVVINQPESLPFQYIVGCWFGMFFFGACAAASVYVLKVKDV